MGVSSVVGVDEVLGLLADVVVTNIIVVRDAAANMALGVAAVEEVETVTHCGEFGSVDRGLVI